MLLKISVWAAFYLASNRIKFRLNKMTTKVTPTSAAIAKTRLPYPKIANTIKLPSPR
jgi:hypothetical protein